MRLLPALLILAACASAAPTVKEPTLSGDAGEDVGHFYSRMVARVCTGDEDEHLVRQIRSFLTDCMAVGYELDDCSLAACDKLRAAKDLANRKAICQPFMP